MSSAPQLRHAAATVHGRYLVQPPAAPGPAPWLVGFHGYAQSAEVFLPMLTALLPGPHWLTCSVQALHPFYAGRTQAVVANWMTSQDRELAIADNIAYVDAVLEGLVREHGAPRAIVFAGFSQGVAMAYRAALAGRRRAAGVLAVGGDVPPELHGTPAERWSAVLAATGSRDEWFTPTRLEQDGQLLRARRPDARTLVFEGGHEWAPGLIEAGRGFLAGLEGAL